MTRDEYEFCKKTLISEQKNELISIQRVKDAEINLKKARQELSESKEELAGIRGAIETFISEIERYERKNETGN